MTAKRNNTAKRKVVARQPVDKGAMGRPRKELDFKKLDALAQYHCTAEEIVAHLNIFDANISYDTVERRIKEKFAITFAVYIKQKHLAHAKPTLRRLQWESAEGGNTAMLIWLGKQYLDQTDKSQQDHRSGDGSMAPQVHVYLPDNGRSK